MTVGAKIVRADNTLILDTSRAPQSLCGILYQLGSTTAPANQAVTPAAGNTWYAFPNTAVSFSLSRATTVLLIGAEEDDNKLGLYRTVGIAGQPVPPYGRDYGGSPGFYYSDHRWISFINLAAGSYTANAYYNWFGGSGPTLNLYGCTVDVYRVGA